MIFAMRPYFERLVSIELSQELAERAQRIFMSCSNVEIIWGDSSEELKCVLDRLDRPALFWLDGHYSGGGTAKGSKATPIEEELEGILEHKVSGHIIAIDDAMCFGRDDDYPEISELEDLVRSKNCRMSVEVKNNIIFVVPEELS